MNARIGKDSRSNHDRNICSTIMHETTNDNGQRIVQLAREHNLLVAQTAFPHRPGRLWTWTSPHDPTAQLDHILINRKWSNSLVNCRAYNTIDVASDHRIVCARIKTCLRATASKKASQRIDWYKLLHQPIQQRFELELNNQFGSLDDLANHEAQSDYDNIIEVVQEASRRILSQKKKTKLPNWVSSGTTELVEKRDLARVNLRANTDPTRRTALQYEWKALCKAVETAYHHDELNFLEDQLQQLKKADEKGEPSKTWKTIRKISGTERKAPVKVRTSRASGRPSRNEYLDEWRTYVERLLNAKPRVAPSSFPTPAAHDLDINTNQITFDEVQRAIEALNNNKAPGFDEPIVAELLKRGGDALTRRLLSIIQRVFKGEKPPWQWTTSKVIPVPKKGDLTLMSNYIGISLMSTGAKLYNLYK